MSGKFYILDVRSTVGNCAMFWRPNGNGYTTQLDEAGLYDEEGAKRLTGIAVPEDMAKACSVTHVRIERLRTAVAEAGVAWPSREDE